VGQDEKGRTRIDRALGGADRQDRPGPDREERALDVSSRGFDCRQRLRLGIVQCQLEGENAAAQQAVGDRADRIGRQVPGDRHDTALGEPGRDRGAIGHVSARERDPGLRPAPRAWPG
jgi:hypothetical protein